MIDGKNDHQQILLILQEAGQRIRAEMEKKGIKRHGLFLLAASEDHTKESENQYITDMSENWFKKEIEYLYQYLSEI